MSAATFLSFLILYPISLLADGCAFVSIALAATMGGRASAWGASFAFFHAIYAITGVLLAQELTEYSQTLGDLFVMGGALILLRHFLHHRFSHAGHGACGCAATTEGAVTTGTMLSTAGTLSFHALAAGALVQEILGPLPATSLVPLLLGTSALLGIFITVMVHFGEVEKSVILRILDRAPGIFAGFLAGVCCWTLYHALEHTVTLSTAWNAAFLVLSFVGIVAVGYVVHERSAVATLPASRKA